MGNTKITKGSTIVGCSLLTIMAVFHLSGIQYINGLIQQSNSRSFVKEIFPILFVHPSIQLLGLAGLGMLTLFMRYESGKILVFIAIMVLLDSFLAFHLGAILPGILLIFTSIIFLLGGIKKK